MIQKIKILAIKPTLTCSRDYAVKNANLEYYKATGDAIKMLPFKQRQSGTFGTFGSKA